MTHEQSAPYPSYPAVLEDRPLRRRSIFSYSTMRLDQVHVTLLEGQPSVPKKYVEDHSLQLLDDLTNRSIDPMFLDTKLIIKPISRLERWTMRIIIVILCTIIGATGYIFVRNLHIDYRKKIRQYLISQIHETKHTVESYSRDIVDLRKKVQQQTSALDHQSDTALDEHTSLINGTSAIAGEGITVTLANPLIDYSSLSQKPIEQVQVVTDIDLQQIVNLLWQAGAKAIAINGNRLGVQTSIRVAGQTILVGTTGIQSPYTIDVVGPQGSLLTALDADHQPQLHHDFKHSGISFHVSKSDMLSLPETIPNDVTYAQRSTH